MGDTATGLWQGSDVELVSALTATEVELRQAHSRMLGILSEVDGRGVAATLGYANTPALLVHVLRISRGEARNRVAQAEDLVSRTTLTGSVVEASLPRTAEALARGEIGLQQVDVIRKTLAGLSDVVGEKRVLAESEMLKQAAEDDPNALARFGAGIRDLIDPDGPPPLDPDPQPTQWVRRHVRRDGRMELKALLDVENAQRLEALLKPFEKPHPEGNDTRSHSERAGDAFADVLRMAANCPDLPTQNGLKTEIALIVDIDKLRNDTEDLVLPGQTGLTVREMRRLACDSHILPAVMDGDSKPLDVAVPAYVVPAHIRRGLVLRDRGCAFPGCERPASATDSHHIRSWIIHNGPTQLDNLVLLCGAHHRLIHRSEWTVELVNGWACFTPPAYVDPMRKPRYNTLHRTRLPAAAA
jgi:hypothetical protein